MPASSTLEVLLFSSLSRTVAGLVQVSGTIVLQSCPHRKSSRIFTFFCVVSASPRSMEDRERTPPRSRDATWVSWM